MYRSAAHGQDLSEIRRAGFIAQADSTSTEIIGYNLLAEHHQLQHHQLHHKHLGRHYKNLGYVGYVLLQFLVDLLRNKFCISQAMEMIKLQVLDCRCGANHNQL